MQLRPVGITSMCARPLTVQDRAQVGREGVQDEGQGQGGSSSGMELQGVQES